MEHYAYLLKSLNYDLQNIDEIPFLVIPEVLDFSIEKHHDESTKFLQKLFDFSDPFETMDCFVDMVDSTDEEELLKQIKHSDLYNELLNRYKNTGEYTWALDIETRLWQLSNDDFLSLAPSTILRSLINKISSTIYAIKSSHLAAVQYNIDPILYNGNLHIYDWLFTNNILTKDYSVQLSVEEQIVAKSLLGEETNFLEALSIEDLQIIREEGLLENLRKALRLERNQIGKTLDVANIEDSTNKFTSNMLSVIKDYENEYLSNLKTQGKNKLIRYLSLAGSMALGASTLVFPEAFFLAIFTASSGVLLGGKSIRDIVMETKKEKENIEMIKRNPISVLYGAYKNYNNQVLTSI